MSQSHKNIFFPLRCNPIFADKSVALDLAGYELDCAWRLVGRISNKLIVSLLLAFKGMSVFHGELFGIFFDFLSALKGHQLCTSYSVPCPQFSS